MSLDVQVWGRARKTFGFGGKHRLLCFGFVQDKNQDCHPASPPHPITGYQDHLESTRLKR